MSQNNLLFASVPENTTESQANQGRSLFPTYVVGGSDPRSPSLLVSLLGVSASGRRRITAFTFRMQIRTSIRRHMPFLGTTTGNGVLVCWSCALALTKVPDFVVECRLGGREREGTWPRTTMINTSSGGSRMCCNILYSQNTDNASGPEVRYDR